MNKRRNPNNPDTATRRYWRHRSRQMMQHKVNSFSAEYIVFKSSCAIKSVSAQTKRASSLGLKTYEFHMLCAAKCFLIETSKDAFNSQELIRYINQLSDSNLTRTTYLNYARNLAKKGFLMLVSKVGGEQYSLTMKARLFFRDLNKRWEELMANPLGLEL